MDEELTTPKEVESLSESISEFNKSIDDAIRDLNNWKNNLASLQEGFVEKLKKRTLDMKIK